MRHELYLEVGGIPVPSDDLMFWALQMEHADRSVGKTKVGDLLVSTVFLGLDHNYQEEGPPILYETMVFDEDHKCVDDWAGESSFWGEVQRYSTREEAQAGHEATVNAIKEAQVDHSRRT
jgi:hypothetical protein